MMRDSIRVAPQAVGAEQVHLATNSGAGLDGYPHPPTPRSDRDRLDRRKRIGCVLRVVRIDPPQRVADRGSSCDRRRSGPTNSPLLKKWTLCGGEWMKSTLRGVQAVGRQELRNYDHAREQQQEDAGSESKLMSLKLPPHQPLLRGARNNVPGRLTWPSNWSDRSAAVET